MAKKSQYILVGALSTVLIVSNVYLTLINLLFSVGLFDFAQGLSSIFLPGAPITYALASLGVMVVSIILLIVKFNNVNYKVLSLLLGLGLIANKVILGAEIGNLFVFFYLLLLVLLIILTRKISSKTGSTSLIIYGLIALSSVLILKGETTSFKSLDEMVKNQSTVDPRVDSTVKAAFRSKWYNYETSKINVAPAIKLLEKDIKYFGMFDSKNCTETGSTALENKDKLDYRYVYSKYYSRLANSGNLWTFDPSGYVQNVPKLTDLEELYKSGLTGKWGVCSTIMETIPSNADFFRTSNETDKTRYFSLKLNNDKLVKSANLNSWIAITEHLHISGVKALYLYSKRPQIDTSTFTKINIVAYILDDNGLITQVQTGYLRGQWNIFVPHSVINLTDGKYSPIAIPNFVDKTPYNKI